MSTRSIHCPPALASPQHSSCRGTWRSIALCLVTMLQCGGCPWHLCTLPAATDAANPTLAAGPGTWHRCCAACRATSPPPRPSRLRCARCRRCATSVLAPSCACGAEGPGAQRALMAPRVRQLRVYGMRALASAYRPGLPASSAARLLGLGPEPLERAHVCVAVGCSSAVLSLPHLDITGPGQANGGRVGPARASESGAPEQQRVLPGPAPAGSGARAAGTTVS